MGVYLWTEEWLPWENTVAYFPFNWNLNDLTGNYTWTAIGTINYSTWVKGDWISKTTSNAVLTNIPWTFFWSAFTIIMWFKFNSINSVVRFMWGYAWSSTAGSETDYANIQYESWQWGLQFYNYNAQRTSWSWTPATNTWYCIGITWWWVANDLRAYVNGVELSKIRSSYNYNTRAESNVALWICAGSWAITNNQTFAWMIDEAILENKQRTSSEMLDYYNSIIS
jgi:hypothetical protein